MNLRKKALLIVSLPVTVLILILIVVSQIILMQGFVLDDGIAFLQKPFTAEALRQGQGGAGWSTVT